MNAVAIDKKIILNEKEYDLPEGIIPLGEDGLYQVDWNLIEIAHENSDGEKIIKEITESNEFKFFNPRHFGYEANGSGEIYRGQGLNKDEMQELMTDILNNGLDYPLQTHFCVSVDADGQLAIRVRVHDGERRWRCLDRMIRMDAKVYSRRLKQFAPAKEVYSSVPCRVGHMTEEEAFQRACAISETAVKWGDAACARLVKLLYAKNYKDEQICKMLGKGKQWLAETYSLNELDDFCFSFLSSGKMNRKVALDLTKIRDVDLRRSWLMEGWKNALHDHASVEVKNERLLQKAEVREEIAEAEVEEAKVKGEAPEVIHGLEEAASEAAEKTKQRKQIKAASAKPVVKSKNLRKATGILSALRAPKIKKILLVVEGMIEKGEGDIRTLHVLRAAYQGILDGEEDVNLILKKLAS